MYSIVAIQAKLQFDLLDDIAAIPFQYPELILKDSAQLCLGNPVIDMSCQLSYHIPGKLRGCASVQDLDIYDFGMS